MMRAIWMRLRAELRGRWKAWLGLAALIGLFGGAVLACLAGSRRTDSAYDRFLVDTRAWDAVTFYAPFDPSFAVLHHADVEALPVVAEDAAAFYYEAEGGIATLASDDPAFGRTFNGIRMLKGRVPDPNEIDEMSVPYELVEVLGARIGQQLSMTLFEAGPGTPGASVFEHGGPKPMTFQVVGIHMSPGEFPPGTQQELPLVLLTPAFHRAHGADTFNFGVGFFRLEGGDASVQTFRDQIEELAGGKPFFVLRQADQTDVANEALHLLAVALFALAVVLSFVGVLAFGQSLGRQTFLDSEGFPVARALGMTGVQLFAIGIARAVLIGGAAGVIAVGTAITLSPLAPIGIARLVETSPGSRVDLFVLATGGAAIAAMVVLLTVYPAWRAERAVAERQRSGRSRSNVARAAFRAGLSPAAVAGIRLALERGRGRTAVPVRSTVGAATVGVAALLMAATFGASLDRLLATPELYGVRWDTEVNIDAGFRSGTEPSPAFAIAEKIRDIEGVEDAATMDAGAPFTVDGFSATGLIYDPARLGLAPAMLSGTYPERASEIALGTRTLAEVGKSIGDDVEVALPGVPSHRFRIVGTVALPGFSVADSLGEGSFLHPSAIFRFLDEPPLEATVYVRYEPGADRAAISKQLLAIDKVNDLTEGRTPNALVNLGRVRDLPTAIAALLALFAAATIGHALASSARRRGRDLAILRVLGFVRRQIRSAVAWQAATLAAISVAIGVPAGIAAGRWLWAVVADGLGIVPDSATAWLAVALALPIAVLVAAGLSILPARMALGRPPATALREE